MSLELGSALHELAEVDLASLPAVVLGAEISDLLTARNQIDGEIQRRLATFDSQGMGQADGAPSTSAWLRGRCRLAPSEASARVKTARVLRELPMVASALQRGEISLDHARAVSLLAAQTHVDDTRKVQRQLVEVARLTDPARFGGELRAIRDAMRRNNRGDGDGPDESDGFARRELSLTPVLDGFNLRGWLPDEAGSLVKTVLDSLAAPLPVDLRTGPQRTADALVELCTRAAAGGELPVNHGVRPHLFVVATVETLLDAERAAMARLGYGASVGKPATQRIACDAVVTRVLLSPEGQVLDLGRTTRVVTTAQWRALLVRDGGCVFPDCDRPPQWCDAHHLTTWLDGGPTDLANLALVCGFHHRLVHEGAWTLTVDGDLWRATGPGGRSLRGDPVGCEPDRSHGARRARRLADAIRHGPRGPCPD